MSISEIVEEFLANLLLPEQKKEKRIADYTEVFNRTQEKIINELLMSKKSDKREMGRFLLRNITYLYQNANL